MIVSGGTLIEDLSNNRLQWLGRETLRKATLFTFSGLYLHFYSKGVLWGYLCTKINMFEFWTQHLNFQTLLIKCMGRTRFHVHSYVCCPSRINCLSVCLFVDSYHKRGSNKGFFNPPSSHYFWLIIPRHLKCLFRSLLVRVADLCECLHNRWSIFPCIPLVKFSPFRSPQFYSFIPPNLG